MLCGARSECITTSSTVPAGDSTDGECARMCFARRPFQAVRIAGRCRLACC